MRVRYSKENEKEIAIKFWRDSFKDNEEQIDFYFNKIFDYKNYLVLEDKNKIVSSLHENPYIFNFLSKKINTKYIVGVASDIALRNKGYMKTLFIEMFKKLKNKNVPFIFLNPINPAIYRKFGFEYFSNIEYYNFSMDELKKFIFPKNDFEFININDENIINFFNDLIKIYNYNMKNKICYLERNELYFQKIFDEIKVDGMKFYILYKKNIPSAYIIFGMNENKIEIRECLAIDIESYKEILSFISGYKDYYSEINLASPYSSDIDFIFENQLKIEKYIKPFMMLRILDVKKTLEYMAISSFIKISVIDNILIENTAIFSFENGNVQILENVIADVEIDVKDLVFLVTGYLDIDKLIHLNKIKFLSEDNHCKEIIISEFKKIFPVGKSYLYEFI